MFFLELLMALVVQMIAMFGKPGAIAIISVVCILGVIGVSFFAQWLTDQLLSHGQSPTITGRIAEKKAAARRELKMTQRIDALDDAALQDLIEKHPDDTFALGRWCERLKERGDLEAYALAREKLLSVDRSMSAAEKSTQCHLLADFYLKRLNKPERAQKILADFIAEFPRSPEAMFMRERLARMEATPSSWGGKGGSGLTFLADEPLPPPDAAHDASGEESA
jgi:hypothetical protein